MTAIRIGFTSAHVRRYPLSILGPSERGFVRSDWSEHMKRHTRNALTVCLVLTVLFLMNTVCGQALVGSYTVAAGNPGNAFDYRDIGDFFDDLETLGVAGPVTLNVFDTGGAFTSGPSYQLGSAYVGPQGLAGNIVLRPVTGLGATSPLAGR